MTTETGANRLGKDLAGELRNCGVQGVLVQMAERRQIIELTCEMPQCYCPKGRGYLEKRTTPLRDWAPSPDYYPILRSAGGHLVPENVRLSHLLCNRRDYGWKTKIKTMLAKGMGLEEIAEKLNQRREPRPHGHPTWTAAVVRKAFRFVATAVPASVRVDTVGADGDCDGWSAFG